jgi:hypothetical protein
MLIGIVRIIVALFTAGMLWAGCHAHADETKGKHVGALKVDSGDNKTVYFSKDGKQLDSIEAFKEAIAGREVLGCSVMEAVGNARTGKVTLKKKQ